MFDFARIMKKKEQLEVQNTIIELMESQGKNAVVNVNVFNRKRGHITEPFIQVIQSTELLLVQLLTRAEYQVFGFLRAYSQWNNQINVDIKIISATIDVSDRSVKSAIKRLENLNIIKVIKSPFDARRNIYEINPQNSWKGTAEEYNKMMERFGYEKKLAKGVNQLSNELKKQFKLEFKTEK
jgi:DNA-binding MarR family transcriptional regulator